MPGRASSPALLNAAVADKAGNRLCAPPVARQQRPHVLHDVALRAEHGQEPVARFRLSFRDRTEAAYDAGGGRMNDLRKTALEGAQGGCPPLVPSGSSGEKIATRSCAR